MTKPPSTVSKKGYKPKAKDKKKDVERGPDPPPPVLEKDITKQPSSSKQEHNEQPCLYNPIPVYLSYYLCRKMATEDNLVLAVKYDLIVKRTLVIYAIVCLMKFIMILMVGSTDFITVLFIPLIVTTEVFIYWQIKNPYRIDSIAMLLSCWIQIMGILLSIHWILFVLLFIMHFVLLVSLLGVGLIIQYGIAYMYPQIIQMIISSQLVWIVFITGWSVWTVLSTLFYLFARGSFIHCIRVLSIVLFVLPLLFSLR